MAPKRNAASQSKNAGSSERRILVTAGEGQTGRLVLELLVNGDDYATKHSSLSALVFSEEAKESLAEFPEVEVHVFDPAQEDALLKAMEAVDTCMLIPPARKVRTRFKYSSPERTAKQEVLRRTRQRSLALYLRLRRRQKASRIWCSSRAPAQTMQRRTSSRA